MFELLQVFRGEHVVHVSILLFVVDRHVGRCHQLSSIKHRAAKTMTGDEHDHWSTEIVEIVRERGVSGEAATQIAQRFYRRVVEKRCEIGVNQRFICEEEPIFDKASSNVEVTRSRRQR